MTLASVHRALIATCLLAGLSACVTTEDLNASLAPRVGQTEEQLVRQFGVPTDAYEVGDTRALAWDRTRVELHGGRAPGFRDEVVAGEVRRVFDGGSSPTEVELTCRVEYFFSRAASGDWVADSFRHSGNECLRFELL
ncbi:MAG: hypothetical protein AAFQ51_08970 [Pseudomonadota bacterium]